MTSNLRLRILSALVMAAVALGITWIGDWPFRILAVLAGLAIFAEWTTISGISSRRGVSLAYFVLVGIPLLLVLVGVPVGVVLLALLAVFLLGLAIPDSSGESRWGAWGILYVVLPVVSMSMVRGDTTAGLVGILFLFAVVWGTDIFAYFIGRAIGGPKLAPAISPGKTWSGAVGGAVCGTAAGIAVLVVAGTSAGWAFVAIAVVLSVFSQIGDLFESWIKRRFGMKDSSSFIPGHGGVMDRLDGLVAAAFGLYVIGWLVSGAETPAAGLFGN